MVSLGIGAGTQRGRGREAAGGHREEGAVAGRLAGVREGLAVGVWLLAGAAPGQGEALGEAREVLTLDGAVTLALQNNRNLEVAAMQVERAGRQLEAARARRLPSLEVQAVAGAMLTPVRVSFPAGAFGSYPGIGPIPSAERVVEAPRSTSGNVNATLAQPLTQLYKIGLNTRLAELNRDAERESLRGQRLSVVGDVRRLYYELVQAESAVEAAEDRVKTFREMDRVVAAQLAAEVVLRSDALQVKSRLATEESALEGVRGDLATARERMNDLLGRDLDHDFAVVAAPDAPAEEGDLQQAIAAAVERRPDLAQARLAVKQADTDRRLKKAESIPEVSLAITYYSFTNVDLLPRNVAVAGLQVRWEPFDWGRKGKERAEKELQVEQARTRAREAENQARIEVAHRFRKLREARLSLGAQRLAREAADEALRVAARRYGRQAVLLKDVLDAQASAAGARAQYEAALATLWAARADFEQAVGEER
jgi:outer membrane protein TolC